MPLHRQKRDKQTLSTGNGQKLMKALELENGQVPQSEDLSYAVKISELKNFSAKFKDVDAFTTEVQIWLENEMPSFGVPFRSEEIRQLDYALEGVVFQQLLRMPYPEATKEEIGLAVEDFLHTSTVSIWEAFWNPEEEMPFFVVGSARPKISSKKKSAVDAVALVMDHGKKNLILWEQVATFINVETEIGEQIQEGNSVPFPSTISRALFHALHILVSRAYSGGKSARNDSVYVVFVDSRNGAVLKLQGDVMKLNLESDLCYESASDWIQKHAIVCVSQIEQIWNPLGNPNWSDLGAMQILLTIYNCIEQCEGPPSKSLAQMATDHNSRLQRRKIERRLAEMPENGTPNRHRQTPQRIHGEIEEEIEELERADSESDHRSRTLRKFQKLGFDSGTILWVEDGDQQKGFQVHKKIEGKNPVYSAFSLDEGRTSVLVQVGAHPSQLEPCWEDMNSWYQVQRQTKILNIMKNRGICSRHIPQIISSGRLLHPGKCSKQSSGSRCSHPWCGIPVLVSFPLGESIAQIMERGGIFQSREILRICYHCLSALQICHSAHIYHGDLRLEHIIQARSSDGKKFYCLNSWGHAVLEDRDSPAISPLYSSTYALQEGKLCPASDAESLIYIIFFLSGGSMPQFDSMESAMVWREKAWAHRSIQQQIGEISPVLKAFADYIDSLIGTPYPVDYDIWLRRLKRSLHGHDPVKKLEYLPSPSPARAECSYAAAGSSR